MHVRYGIKFLIFDQDMLHSVLGLSPAGRHHGRNGFALPAHPLDRDGALRRGFQTLQMREHADPRRDDGGEFLTCNHSDYTRHVPGRRSVDAKNLCVRVRRAQEHDMHHTRQFDVADIEPASLHQPVEVRPRHRFADIGVWPVQRRKRFGIYPFRRHGRRPARARAVVSMASTIA